MRASPRVGLGHRTFYHTHKNTGVLMVAMICFATAIVDHNIDCATVDVYDSTFNTNRYNYKLGVSVYTTRDGRSRIKAVTFMLIEDVASFTLVLQWYLVAFGSPMTTLITDGDYQLHLAIVAVFGPVFALYCHLLCVWHLAENVKKHTRYIFGPAIRGKRGGSEGTDAYNKFIRARLLQAYARDRVLCVSMGL